MPAPTTSVLTGTADVIAESVARSLFVSAPVVVVGNPGRPAELASAVAPGSTATGPFAEMTAWQRAEAGSAFALGRIGEPADTAAVVAFLASADAGFVTGQVIYCAGGQRGPIRWTER